MRAFLFLQVLPILYEAGNPVQQNSKLQHKLESFIEEVSQTCSSDIQVSRFHSHLVVGDGKYFGELLPVRVDNTELDGPMIMTCKEVFLT